MYFCFVFFRIQNEENIYTNSGIFGAYLVVSGLTQGDKVFLTGGKIFRCPGRLAAEISAET